MIPVLALLFLAGEPAGAQIAPMKVPGASRQMSRVSSSVLTPLEQSFNDRLSTMFDRNEPADLLGNTRGVYLQGFGAVFTTEMSLVLTPAATPFRGKITKEFADSIRQKKIQRLPFLKAAMKEMMHNMAAAFQGDDQMVLVVRFYYEPWEDMTGMPSQVLMRAPRKDALTGNVQVEEQ
jgi:hypothetical protein